MYWQSVCSIRATEYLQSLEMQPSGLYLIPIISVIFVSDPFKAREKLANIVGNHSQS